MQLSDFDFELPAELIAQQPLSQRSASRLLHLQTNEQADRQFAELPGLLRPNDLLVVNDSKVMPARLFGRKPTGGRVEVLVERITDTCDAIAFVGASKPTRPGTTFELDAGTTVTVKARDGDLFVLQFSQPVLPLLFEHGQMPLPPYINRQTGERPSGADNGSPIDDRERYQTVFARDPGSVAAPTAGLHFDQDLIVALNKADIALARITLHVGAGTFAPVRADDISAHQMHTEMFQISQDTRDAIARTRELGARVIAVGTTSLRALESAADPQAPGQVHSGPASTALFITPGHPFKVIDGLITNFHLPRSTLLMLVSAIAGRERVLAAYQHAVTQQYRFFSYGDAMFFDMSPPGRPAQAPAQAS